MLLTRVFSALVGVPLLLYIFWYGRLPLLILTGLLVSIGIWEFYQMMGRTPNRPSLAISLSGSLIVLTLAYLNREDLLGPVLVLLTLVNLILLLWRYPEFSVADAALTLFGIFYVGWLISHFYLIRSLPDGVHYALLALLATWATDTGAYFTGRSLGTRKLAPVLSPKKTVEGAFGGVAGGVIVALVFSFFGPAPFYHYLILGIFLGIGAQAGDLMESGLKRLAGVKDSGRLIPGHGGVLDRFDSLMVTAPLVYYYARMFIIS